MVHVYAANRRVSRGGCPGFVEQLECSATPCIPLFYAARRVTFFAQRSAMRRFLSVGLVPIERGLDDPTDQPSSLLGCGGCLDEPEHPRGPFPGPLLLRLAHRR